ncbi:ankyrin repeat-containing domain protein, partial [Multifurca ochricompacta]
LHYAAICGVRDVVEWLVTIHSQDVNTWNRYSTTPLRYVSHRGDLEVGRYLIGHGADVNAWGCKGWTPLRHVVDGGHLEVVQLLLDHGAEPV